MALFDNTREQWVKQAASESSSEVTDDQHFPQIEVRLWIESFPHDTPSLCSKQK